MDDMYSIQKEKMKGDIAYAMNRYEKLPREVKFFSLQKLEWTIDGLNSIFHMVDYETVTELLVPVKKALNELLGMDVLLKECDDTEDEERVAS